MATSQNPTLRERWPQMAKKKYFNTAVSQELYIMGLWLPNVGCFEKGLLLITDSRVRCQPSNESES